MSVTVPVTAELPSAEVVLAHAQARVVLFDFDGVLIRGDAFYLFIRDRYARSLWRRILAVLSAPLLVMQWPFSWYLPIRTLVRIALLGMDNERYRVVASAFAADLVRRPGQFSRDAMQTLRRHQVAGDRVLVVTGCELTLVTAILEQLGLKQLEVLGSQLRHGWLGMRPHVHNVGAVKVKHLAQHGLTEWQVAYSDSLRDLPMLKGAAEAVLVNGTPAVYKKAEKALSRMVTRVDWF